MKNDTREKYSDSIKENDYFLDLEEEDDDAKEKHKWDKIDWHQKFNVEKKEGKWNSINWKTSSNEQKEDSKWYKIDWKNDTLGEKERNEEYKNKNKNNNMMKKEEFSKSLKDFKELALDNFITKKENNNEELELIYYLKNLYIRSNNISKLSDKKFSAIIGIRISDLNTRKTQFSSVRFKKLYDFIDGFDDYDKKKAEDKIKNLLKKRLSIKIPLEKAKNAEYSFTHDLLELYREKDLFIVLKKFCSIIDFYLSSSLNKNNRILDSSIDKIRKNLVPYFNSDQISRLDIIINDYKENRCKLELKKFDTDYKKELKNKIKYIFEYLPIPDNFKKQDLLTEALKYFDVTLGNNLTYQDMIPSAHSGYIAPALVYFVLRSKNIYHINNSHISAYNIISKKKEDLEFLRLTKRTCRDIPIKKLYNYLSEEIRDKVGILSYKDYTEDDFVKKFEDIRSELDFPEDEYPKGRELDKINPKYKAFVRASYRYGENFDNIVEKSGFEPFRKIFLKYEDFKLEDYAKFVEEIAEEFGYDKGICPSSKDLERYYQPFYYSFKKKGYILKDLIPFGLYPSDYTLSKAVGVLVHYIFEYEIIKYLLDKVNLKTYYEIYPNIYSLEYNRVDNAILNNSLFKKKIFSNQNIINLTDSQLRKINLFLFDYTISSDQDLLINKCNRNYHNSHRFLIIVSLFRKIYDIPNNVPYKSQVVQLDFNEFSQLLLLPDWLHKYLKEIILLSKNALYTEDMCNNPSLEKLSIIGNKARKEMLDIYRPLCNQEALEKHLLDLFKDIYKVENFLKNNSC